MSRRSIYLHALGQIFIISYFQALRTVSMAYWSRPRYILRKSLQESEVRTTEAESTHREGTANVAPIPSYHGS